MTPEQLDDLHAYLAGSDDAAQLTVRLRAFACRRAWDASTTDARNVATVVANVLDEMFGNAKREAGRVNPHVIATGGKLK